MVDKTTADAIVARRIFVFKAALAEVGLDPGEVVPDGTGYIWFVRLDLGVAYRAGALARLAAPFHGDTAICFDCWQYTGGQNPSWEGCRRLSPLDALRFSSCGATPTAAAAA